MRLAFAGTPSTAVPSLRALLDSPRHEVVAVITRPPAGPDADAAEVASPVADLAAGGRRAGPRPRAKAGDPDFLAQLRRASGRLLPGRRLRRAAADRGARVPPHGWVNLHFSLLPAWRGAAPVQHAILHGDDITGASTFQIEAGLDTGPVYGVVTEPIRPADTAGDLLDAAGRVGRRAARRDDGRHRRRHPRAAPAAGGRGVARGQDHRRRRRVDWSAPGRHVDRLVRACTPAPGAWTTFRGERLKLGPVSAPTARCGRRPAMAQVARRLVEPAGRGRGRHGDRSGPARQGAAGRASIDAGGGLGERRAAAARRASWRGLIRPVESPSTCFARSMPTARTPTCVLPAADRAVVDRPRRRARHRARLRHVARRRHARRDPRRLHRPAAGRASTPPVRDLLRLGAYQALRTRVPRARRGRHHRRPRPGDRQRAGRRFVNAVLRRVARDDWEPGSSGSARATPRCGRLALQTAHPEWIADAFRRRARGAARRRSGRDRRRACAPTTAGRRPTWSPGRAASTATSWSGNPAASPARGRPTRCGSPAATRASSSPSGTGRPRCRTRAASCARWPWPTRRSTAATSAGSTCAPAPAARRRCSPRSRRSAAHRHRQRAAPAPGRARPPGHGASGTVVGAGRRCARLSRDRRRLRPGAARRAVHRAGRAAPPPGGALAARSRRRRRSWPSCSASCSPPRCGCPARRRRRLRDLLAAPGRDRRGRGQRRHDRRRVLDARPGSPAFPTSGPARPCSCGRTGTAPTPCSARSSPVTSAR